MTPSFQHPFREDATHPFHHSAHPPESSIQVDVCVQINGFSEPIGEDPSMGQEPDTASQNIASQDIASHATGQSSYTCQDIPWRHIPWQYIPWTEWIHSWLTHLAPSLSPIDAYELTLRLTTDAEIQQLNADYRGKDVPTDVLAFATLDADAIAPTELYNTQPYYLGDIIISLETATGQARAANHALTCELAWLSSHGLLHLLGWDHPDDPALQRMLNEQDVLLRLLDIHDS